MRPSQIEPYGSQRTDRIPHWPQEITNSLQSQSQSQSQSSTRRLRSEDSWIEIASQPSSSSLASLHREEIITTGLQIRREDDRQPRELHISNLHQPTSEPRSASVAGSSQDEYEESESESESDRVMSSSNEDLQNESNGEDEDDTSTALGIGSTDRNVFTPQPNAFSHPPNGRSESTSQGNTYFSSVPPHPHETSDRLPSNRLPNIQRPIARERTSSSNVQPDHDAALRASLTTLLSCAAAVRKDKEPEQITRRPSTQPTTLRLVPGSELNAGRSHPPSQKPVQKRRSRESSKERHAKKLRSTKTQIEDEAVSPTMMTWFVSAGVVLVFSVISFGAGYAWGKEVGRIEGQMGLDGSACGRDALRGSRTGLSKLRLTSVRA